MGNGELLRSRWSELGQRIRYNPLWMQDASDVIYHLFRISPVTVLLGERFGLSLVQLFRHKVDQRSAFIATGAGAGICTQSGVVQIARPRDSSRRFIVTFICRWSTSTSR